MRPDLRCYHHPDREATGQCDRCGDYLCDECRTEWEGTPVCTKCRAELDPSARLGAVPLLVCAFSCATGLLWILIVAQFVFHRAFFRMPDPYTTFLVALPHAVWGFLLACFAWPLSSPTVR